MDIQHLVDRLEDLIDEGRHVPFSRFTMIDEERALELIDQMRISIPEEIEKAARVLAQRDRILAQANEEAARIVQQARERSNEMIDREAMVQAAQNRAANIVEQAHQEAAEIMRDADNYVLGVLSNLEQQLSKAMTVVRNGINSVGATSETAPAAAQVSSPPAAQASYAAPAPRPMVEVGSRTEQK
ncbi:MAG: ATP synthase F0 subunit B [Chloroflexota bacterium]|nr:MAG: ATPase [Chloroflexota bacterium]